MFNSTASLLKPLILKLLATSENKNKLNNIGTKNKALGQNSQSYYL